MTLFTPLVRDLRKLVGGRRPPTQSDQPTTLREGRASRDQPIFPKTPRIWTFQKIDPEISAKFLMFFLSKFYFFEKKVDLQRFWISRSSNVR